MANWLDDLADYGSTSWDQLTRGLPSDFGAPYSKMAYEKNSNPHLPRWMVVGKPVVAAGGLVGDALYNTGAFVKKVPSTLAYDLNYLLGDPTQVSPSDKLSQSAKTAEQADRKSVV